MTAVPGANEQSHNVPKDAACRRLFCRWCRAQQPRGAAVIVSTFGEEAKFWRKPLKDLADTFADGGISTVLVDLSGCGESEGQGSIEAWQEDIQQAIGLVRAEWPSMAHAIVVGVGTAAGLLLAAKVSDRRSLVVWLDPVLDLEQYFLHLIRRRHCRLLLGRATPTHANDLRTIDGCAVSDMFMNGIAAGQSAVRQAVAAGARPSIWVNTQRRSVNKLIPKDWPDQTVTSHELKIDPAQTGAGRTIGHTILATISPSIFAESSLPPMRVQRADPGERRIGHETDYGRAVSIAGCDNRLLRGAWLDVPTGDAAAVFLHGKAGYRIGPNRMFCEAARSLARCGVASLRFDYRGRGDSDGHGFDLERDVNEEDIDRCVEDVMAAVDYVRRGRGKSRVLLCGICVGGYVALRALPVAGQAVTALCLLSPYIMGLEHAAAAKWQWIYQALQGYSRALVDVRSWQRVLRRDASVAAACRNTLRRLHGAGIPHASGPVDRPKQRFPCLQIYGQQDPTSGTAMRLTHKLYGQWLNAESVTYEHADHNFSSPGVQQAAIGEICRFAAEHLRAMTHASQIRDNGGPHPESVSGCAARHRPQASPR